MKKIIISLVLTFYSITSIAAGAAMIDLIFEKGLKSILEQDSAIASSVTKIEDDLFIALRGLTNDSVSTEDAVAAIKSIEVKEAEDLKLQAEVVSLLEKESPTTADIIELKDKMILLAHNLGKLDNATFIACNGSCAEAGSTLVNVTTDSITAVASELPSDPATLKRNVKTLMRTSGFGTYRSLTKHIKSSDLKTLATFLKLAQNGSPATPAQRKMIEAIKEFSTEGNNVALLSDSNPHFFFREMIVGNYQDEELIAFADILVSAAKQGGDRQQAFYDELGKMVKNDSLKKEALEKMKAQNCFFKK